MRKMQQSCMTFDIINKIINLFKECLNENFSTRKTIENAKQIQKENYEQPPKI